MSFHSMVWKEMLRRPGHSLTALLIVALGVSALVAVESVVALRPNRRSRHKCNSLVRTS